MGWIDQEMAGVELKDARLEKRVKKLVERFSNRPDGSIPEVCGDWAGTKAAYRFFDNPKVSRAAIMDSHRQACVKRIGEEERVLVLQDTTSLDFSHHPATTGLGPLENPKQRGMLMHTSMAVSEAGVPLGILDQQMWTRDPAEVGQRHQRKERPIEEKESYKWLAGLEQSTSGLPCQVCVITVADREADVYELFQTAGEDRWYVVRAAWNRRLAGNDPDYLWQAVSRAPVAGVISVEVGRGKDRPPREALLSLRFIQVTLRPPRRGSGQSALVPLQVTVIEVLEENPPPGEAPLHWLLLTNLPIVTFEDAAQCVQWYALRWLVERFHYVLKSGCRLEERQLATVDRLDRLLAVFSIVAWRLLWLTYQARVTADVPCTVALETHEWQALHGFIHRSPILPSEPPSLAQAILWIARLGGFLNRKSDASPGVKVLWRGWRRLQDIADTWLLTHPPPSPQRCG